MEAGSNKVSKKLIQGIGINDANYVVWPTINGKREPCKIYTTWNSMLKRCYDPKSLEKHPSYTGCSVEDKWHSFMNFRSWMLTQDYEGKQLDKDLLLPGNKLYSEKTCIFISAALNLFLLERSAARGDLPIGVSCNGSNYKARCKNPFTKSEKCLGTFGTPEEAHLAWKRYKHTLALEYSKLETDSRVIEALQTRYLI